MSDTGAPRANSVLNPLLGMAVLLAAGLNLLLLAGIGWAAWERATLSARWLQLRAQASPPGADAHALAELLASVRAGSTGAEQLPTDADMARLVAELRNEAANCGATLTQFDQQAAPASTPPQHCFLLRAEGGAPQLLGLLARAAELAPPAARIEDVSLLAQGGRAELSFRLFVITRQGGP